MLLVLAFLPLAWQAAPTTARAAGVCPGAQVDGPWTVLPAPESLSRPVQHVAVGGLLEQVVVAADDRVVARSDDGGCTWREVYRVPATDEAGAAGNFRPQVKDVALVVDAERDVLLISTMTGSVVTLLRSQGGGVPQPVLPSTFVASTTGFAPCNANEGCQLSVSEADPSRVYLHAGGLLEGGGTLWRSDDTGRTFELVHTAVTDPFLAADPTGLRLDGVQQVRTDPQDADALVALYNCDHLARSSDGGTSWDVVERPGDPDDPFMGLAARRPGVNSPQRLVAVEMNQYCTGSSMKALHRSLDGGQTWGTVPLGGPDLHALELDSSGEVGLVVDETGVVTRLDVSSLATTRLSTPDGASVIDPQVLATPGSFAMAAPRAVLLLRLDVEPAVADGLPEDLRPELPPLRPCPEPSLQPGPTAPSSLQVEGMVTVQVGQESELAVQGEAGAGPVAVDVAFLIDDSGSMGTTQESLARSVGGAAGRLRDSDVDLHVGLGRFADLVNLPYQRMLDISPVDCHLDQRLGQFATEGSIEPHLLALEQLVTGSGFRPVGLPAGEQMSFREDALALVVHATDETVADGPAPYPALEQVGEVYRRAGITHLGLSVGGTNLAGTEDGLPVDPDAVRADLARISTATGSLAREPIDCNGDRLPDIGAGDPLVCGFDANLTAADGLLATEVGSIVAQVVDGLVGPVPVRLTVESAPAGVDARVAGAQTFDPREGGQVPGTLTVGCRRPLQDALVLGLRAGGRLLASTEVDVVCTDGAAPAVPAADGQQPAAPAPPAPAFDAPVTGAAAAPPGPPPPVVQIPAPAPAVAGAGAAGAASAGAASSAAGSSLGAAVDPGSGAALAATPEREAARQQAQASVQDGAGRAGDVPLAAVPLAGGALTTALLTVGLLAERRRHRTAPRRQVEI